jgi:hypothetical protein
MTLIFFLSEAFVVLTSSFFMQGSGTAGSDGLDCGSQVSPW